MIVVLQKSKKAGKKFTVYVGGRTIHFGAKGMSDYTIHKDPERKKRYILRHKKREKWGKNGIQTPGFWSRWLLWNKPSIKDSMKSISLKFKIKFKNLPI